MTLFLLTCSIWNTEGINSSPGGTENCTTWLLPSSWETLWYAFGNSYKGSLIDISDAKYIGIPVIFFAEIERVSVVIGASQVAQWWRIYLSVQKMQETWVRSLGREDPWRRKWQPTPVFLPGKSYGQRSATVHAVAKESDRTERPSLFSCCHV